MIRRITAAICLTTAIQIHAAPAPAGRIDDTAAQSSITPEALVQALLQADIVLIGEKHDNPAHHAAKVWLLEQTAGRRRNGSVLLEMLDASQQHDVSRVQQWLLDGGKTPDRRLADKIGWNHAWKWQDYSGVVSAVMRQPAKVLAANPTRSDTRKAADFAPQGTYSGAPQVRQALSRIMSSHHGSTAGMVSMQQFKDHTMAQNLMGAPKPAWLLAGAIHASKQLGVPLFLRDAGAAGRVKVLILADADSPPDAAHGDYIWHLHKTETAAP